MRGAMRSSHWLESQGRMISTHPSRSPLQRARKARGPILPCGPACAAIKGTTELSRRLSGPNQAGPVLPATQSGASCAKLIEELANLASADELTTWAYQNMSTKNRLTADAETVDQ